MILKLKKEDYNEETTTITCDDVAAIGGMCL